MHRTLKQIQLEQFTLEQSEMKQFGERRQDILRTIKQFGQTSEAQSSIVRRFFRGLVSGK